jgi:hypothetical protein
MPSRDQELQDRDLATMAMTPSGLKEPNAKQLLANVASDQAQTVANDENYT